MNNNPAIYLAMKCLKTGDLRRATHICEEVLKIHPQNAEALHLLGVIYYQKGTFDLALKNIKESLFLDPTNPAAHYNLGNIFKEMKRPDDAMACYIKALQLNPSIAHVYMNLGTVLQEKQLFDEAIVNYRKALQYDPDNADAYYNLGIVFEEKERLDEAIICYQKAININPRLIDAYNNLGIIFKNKNQPDKAITYYQKAIELDSNFADAHWNMSHALLLVGKFKEGWKEYEWRWKVKELYENSLPRPRDFSQPVWDGSNIRGLTILLYAEQGFGDTIQFIRYASLVARCGANVIVECSNKLTSLLQNVEGIQQVIPYGERLPKFDVHYPLLGLPLILATTPETIPASTSYIVADSLLVQKWSDKLRYNRAKFKIGLVWSGNPKYKNGEKRSLSLVLFLPLAHFNDVAFCSLQFGEAARQADHPPEDMRLYDYTPEINDFSDTAALIQNLDLVISIDTAVAHLAGALGKPVWTLLPFSPDWRWMLNREDSPWYPTMRLFRQSAPGNWNTVIAHIERELGELRRFAAHAE